MRTIWKYPFQTADTVTIKMPSGAHILKLDIQDGRPCFWALVDIEQPSVPISFRIHSTGEDVDEHKENYIGTYFQGIYVCHVFVI